MSGPYRFTQETPRSPLDRRPQNPLPSQPVSFKTNVNRMKTKKWVEAKKNAYDGDDWGDYDEYDEYGTAEQEPLPPAPDQYAASQPRGYEQRMDQTGGRNFTDPQHQGPPSAVRRNSFEAGEEQRAFSASTSHPPQGFPEQYNIPLQQQQPPPAQQYVHPALRQVSGTESDVSDTPEHRRDFSPSAMPPPLHTRISPAPGSATGSPGGFPPRKSSIGQTEVLTPTSPRDRAPENSAKPLPFIRPADIYRRFEEERERESASLDESRPSVQVAPVQESTNAQQSLLPPVEEGASSFESDFRSVVDNAFTRTDDQRSVPPTPISKSDSGASRTNTESTSGISPIMSRVPSSAAAGVKARNLAGGDGSTPVIAEEPSESGTPVSSPTSALLLGGPHQVPRKPSPSHSRNVSGSSLPRSGLTTPNASGSPARSPIIEPQAQVPEPESAKLSSPTQPPEAMKVSVPTDATVREADIASAVKTSPVEALPILSIAEKDSQKAFLESHQSPTSITEAAPRSRSESPSKGRVQELAGKFGDVSHSRRGSTQSNASRTSLQSWEKSQDNSRSASPTKAGRTSIENLGARPIAEREASFRPQLPGQWQSYATSAASPSKELDQDDLPATDQVTSPLEEVDLTPTTPKRSVSTTDPSKSAPLSESLTNPLTALKAAGAAVGEAVQASVGLASSTSEETRPAQTHGDVLPRPLQLNREESYASSIPPTPPAKDTPTSEMPPPPPLKDKNHAPRSSISSSTAPERPIMVPQLSTDTAADDQESDRLRKEIVASLSPSVQTTAANSALQTDSASLHTGSGPVNRETSSFPSQYESYWADGNRTSSHAQGLGADAQTRSTAGNAITAQPLTQSPVDAAKPSILSRFSWEDGGSGLQFNNSQYTPATVVPEATNQTENEKQLPIPAAERVAEQGSEEFPDPYFGPTHSVTAVKPEPISDADLNARSPVTDLAKGPVKPQQPEPDRAASPPPGLHVVNSAVDPEAVDMPPSLTREVSPISDQARPSQDLSDKVSLTVNVPVHGAAQEPAATSPTAIVSPSSDKPLGFRDILAMKSPMERITSYNKTREYWAHADHGLNDWVSTSLNTNPDLLTQPYPQPRPNLAPSGTTRHRATGSISLFGKHHGSSQAEPSGPSTSQTPTTPTSAPTYQGSGRSAGHQMQSKGKDLLHTAGVLSGKGMTGAKGLFAKGKSRFKSDKASASEPSSREASEEPSELGSAASDTLGQLSLDRTDSLQSERRRRRFSSPFHRSSRSRSRPNSIISFFLPSIESTPRGTPTHSRPQSYHPPEIWVAGPREQSTTPPPAEPERLGVLPSPAKSSFSLLPQDPESDVPPVPPLPENLGPGRSESISHRLLQSVIRYSTPPAVETSKLAESPAFTGPSAGRTRKVDDDDDDDDDDAEAGRHEKTVSAKALHSVAEPRATAGLDLGLFEESEDDLPPQLHHDAISPKDIPVMLGQNLDTMAGASFSADVSPVLAPAEPHRLDGGEDAKRLHPHHHLSGKPHRLPLIHDVSPMITPAKLAVDTSDGSGDEQPTPLALAAPRYGEGSFAYETELLGGDVSPVSSHASDDEENTLMAMPAANTNARQVVVTVDRPRDGDAAGENRGENGDTLKITPRPKPSQQLSAYRVVHAVECTHSQSSFSSWEQESLHESVVAPSQSDESPQVHHQHQAELAPIPKLEGAQATESPSPGEQPTRVPVSLPPSAVAPIKSETSREDPQQSPPSEEAKKSAHKRSESLLSRISSMVTADPASVSPVPSYGPRSRPPSANRPRQISPVKISSIPVHIREETGTANHINKGAKENDNFDLYADHDGVVKDVQDEEGRPLRVATDSAPKTAGPSRPSTSHATKSDTSPPPMEESSGRYSDDRPMSFVWGSRDANGRPQDEINLPGASNADQPPSPPFSRGQRPDQGSNGPIIPNRQAHNPGPLSNGGLLEQPSQGELGSKSVSPLSSHRESSKSPSHSNASPLLNNNVSPPLQVSPPPGLSERPPISGSESSNAHSGPKGPDQRLVQDPRAMVEAHMRGWTPGQPLPQDPRLRGQVPGQTPQMAGHPKGLLPSPRNQYELQQMMARQAMRAPEFKPASSGIQHTKKEDKSSRPKLSSMFKALGKSGSSAPQVPQKPSPQPMQPFPQQANQFQGKVNAPTSPTIDHAARNASLSSGVSDLTPSQVASTKERRSSAFGNPVIRSTSIGQESHVSQESTRVQVTDSRLDLRYPASPPPAQGIPPQQIPQNASIPPRPQNFRTSTSQVPETSGKKKRFSTLGNIFNRSSTTGLYPSKVKMSKEEKKAQKVEKHSSAVPMQTQSGGLWPPQQPTSSPQYGGVQYGPAPVARPFPGFQSAPPQPMQMQALQHQGMSPISPQNIQRQSISPVSPQNIHPHGIPPQYMQQHPQGFHRPPQAVPSQIPPQFQQLPGVSEGSAYMNTRQAVQMIQAQRLQNQARPSTQQIPTAPNMSAQHPPAPNMHQNMSGAQASTSPPVNEYFKPDPRAFKPPQAVHQPTQYHSQPVQQQPRPSMHSQHPHDLRGISSPSSVPVSALAPDMSQRHANSASVEPQYDTPQIPPAYTHVSGAFVSPSSEQPPSHIVSPRGQHYNRQHSDPQMQPISPQVSAMSTSAPNMRQNSSDSVVSPVSNVAPDLPSPSPPIISKLPKQRMSSITEQAHQERLWNLDLPQGATEQEIVRARQRQYMEQQLAAQEQLHAERTGRSPSPRSGQSNQSTSPPPAPTQMHPPQRESGGFRELLPRSSPQPYPIANQQGDEGQNTREQHSPSDPIAPTPVRSGQDSNAAAYPLPKSPDSVNIKSPMNPMASLMPPPPPPKIPHTPIHSSFPVSYATPPPDSQETTDDHDSLYDPPPPPISQHPLQPPYDEHPADEQPPPYSGPGLPNDGMDKDNPRPRPPNIITDAADQNRHLEHRQRQASLGILQHPQPASMAASPQRSSADMGADILRRQLLEQEERARQERLQRAELQRAETARERQERERARARARELERSVSGGGRVGSLRVGTQPVGVGFERSGSVATARPVFELPAEEDDEPVMRATSFPGQEWVPTWTED